MAEIDLINQVKRKNSSGVTETANRNDQTIRIEEREDQARIRKTIETGPSTIQQTVFPHPSDSSLVGRVTTGAPVKVADMDPMSDEQAVETAVSQFPNLAWEAIKAGLDKEKATNVQLDKHIATAQGHQKSIDLLLQMQGELISFNEGEMNEKMKATLAELDERGVSVWSKEKGTKLSKDQVTQLKSHISSKMDKQRSELQILFTTRIQVLIQNHSSIMEALKDLVRNNTRLGNVIVGHYSK